MFTRSDLNSIQAGAGLNLGGIFTWPGIYNTVLPFVFGISGIVLLFNLISAGFKMMTSVGDPKAIQMAKSKITTSLIGILILFSSFWIVQLIWKFIGIDVVVIQ
ncbi:MAG: hypothetical protein WA152_02095 [Microgenomates group bacterium]